MQKPSLFEYLNVTQYLKDYFDWRKSADARFSFEFWAKELGFKSKSYLRMILIGRRKVTEVFETQFVQSMKFSPQETEYFHFLVLHSQAAKQSDRQLYGRKLISLIQAATPQAEVEKYYEFLKDPHLPTLQTLLSFNDITPSVERLSLLMNLSREKTQAALEKLQALDLAESYELEGEIFWRSKNKFFKVPNLTGDLAVENFHRHNLRQATQALTISPDLKHYRCLLLPMNTEEMNEFRRITNEYASTLLAKYGSDEYKGRRVYKVNVIAFPVVEEMEESALSQNKTAL